MQEEFIQIGRLGKPHGLKGAVKVLLWDEFVHFIPKEVVFVELDGSLIPYFFTSFKEQGAHTLVVFEDFDNPNNAYKVAQKKIFVRKQDLPTQAVSPIDSKMDALVGFNIVDATLGLVGSIVDYDDNGAQPMIIVNYQNNEVMIPWVDAYILSFDAEKKNINVDLPEGLVE